ncbi:hypothetical protein PV325_004760 [Microctonus aethiopoides]|uniref:AAA+ ATPase domain-containing protein n=1 Tax=Microctonus aethiopoides TaxID=144406 RepID=A0AA39F0Y2_9HYME|nr:hypothetical protein PV325_004760 [Microctonus aethiopoides]KAK0160531.1 hypothetical protein PV328_007933 [Microctonus aethiopoides]
MSAKSRKSITPWATCEKCKSIVSQKNITAHESECPPSDEKWSHNYIRDGVLYSRIETYEPHEFPRELNEKIAQDFVFMSDSALELCEIAIGKYVMMKCKEHIIVKETFPTKEKSLSSVSLTQKALETYNISNNDLVQVSSFTITPLHPKQIIVKYISKLPMPPNFISQLKKRQHLAINQVLTVGNRISLPYYGRIVKLKVLKILEDDEEYSPSDNIEEEFEKMNLSDEIPKFYKPDFSTKWTLINDNEILPKNIKSTITEEDIGGYEQPLMELKNLFSIILNASNEMFNGHKISKGILVHGTSGVGKTTLIMAASSANDLNIFTLDASLISNQTYEGSKKLHELFNDAKFHTPSVIIIENIDELFNKKISNNVLSITLLQEIDELQSIDIKCLLIATSSKPDLIDHKFRYPGRFRKDYEVCTPTPLMRYGLLKKILTKFPNAITDDELHQISCITHGFVARDLYNLCSEAVIASMKKYCEPIQVDDDENISEFKLRNIDFDEALKIIKPSAMKNFSPEVPNVKWTDIGGQELLKKQLQQAVVWPLKYPKTFSRFKMERPSGILMFGPPGCSKTMIVRALATESKLNFFNMKASDVMSMWVGESEKAVREIFRKARQVAPSIIFIDEIDALGCERASGNAASSGSNVQERVLNELLMELDGITPMGDVAFVAATNRPDRVDKALMRPGRIDEKIYVPLPDAKTREEIFKIRIHELPVDNDVNISYLVESTEGFSGAEVVQLCRKASLLAIDENPEDPDETLKISNVHFEMALKVMSPGTPESLLKLYNDYVNRKL